MQIRVWQVVTKILEKSQFLEVAEPDEELKTLQEKITKDRKAIALAEAKEEARDEADKTEKMTSPPMEDIFSKIFDIDERLARVGTKEDTPVTIVAHLVCPVLKWLNYGKSGPDE